MMYIYITFSLWLDVPDVYFCSYARRAHILNIRVVWCRMCLFSYAIWHVINSLYMTVIPKTMKNSKIDRELPYILISSFSICVYVCSVCRIPSFRHHIRIPVYRYHPNSITLRMFCSFRTLPPLTDFIDGLIKCT